MRIALAQIDTIVGDLEGNTQIIINAIRKAKSMGAELVVFPELTITGYPPKDLLDFDFFVRDNLKYLEEIKAYTKDVGIIIGFIDYNKEPCGKKYHNSAALIYKGEVLAKHDKCLLPYYDVFDETRYFEPGEESTVVEFLGTRIGITICEDIWNDKAYWERPNYETDPVEKVAMEKPDIIVNLSASPYSLNKEKDRFNIIKCLAEKYKIPFAYVNQTGGNDDLIFDGVSFVVNKDGEIKAMASDFKEDVIMYSMDTGYGDIHKISDSEEKSLFKALRIGLKDYCNKLGFKKVIVGLSGGIDSAVVAALACYSLGSTNVLGITMPSMYSSSGSVTDSEILANNLDMKLLNIPIKGIFDAYVDAIQGKNALAMDLAEENLQARIRGNILMTYSNRYGYLLLSTGNKSEMSVGYCTLYGDMAGGLALLSDVPKTMVYRLAEFINFAKEIIPVSILHKAPSAELRPDQKDQDSLPSYDVLDDILKMYVEEYQSPEDIAKKYDKDVVNDVIRKINMNEYKRKQAALGLKVTTKAFGSGRRFPIVQKYDFKVK